MRKGFLFLLLFLFVQFGFAQTYSIIDTRAIKLHEQGDELVKQRKYDEALEKYQASINREANFLESYIKMGRVLLTKGLPQDALSIVERGEKRLSKASDKVKGELGWLKMHIYLAQGEFEKAIQKFDEVDLMLEENFRKTYDYQ